MLLIVSVVAAGLGLAFVVVGALMRSRDRDRELRELLELPYGEQELTKEQIERVSVLEPGVEALDSALERLEVLERLRRVLERARVPLRPAEFVLLVAIASIVAALWTWFAVGQVLFGVLGLLAVPAAGTLVLRRRDVGRRRAFEDQLPAALQLIGSSLQAGHSLLHAVEMMVEEADPPLADEFERVVAETRLGDSVVDSMARLADRLQIRDFDWVVQAVRIQQSVGGKLAELLFTLADYLRTRQEFHREVRVLTAEGRLSAVILAALPGVVLLGMQATNPDYVSALYQTPGLFLLVGAVLSVAIGVAIVLRMVKVEL